MAKSDQTSYWSKAIGLTNPVIADLSDTITDVPTKGSSKIISKDVGYVYNINTHLYPMYRTGGWLSNNLDSTFNTVIYGDDFSSSSRHPELWVDVAKYLDITWSVYRFRLYDDTNNSSSKDLVMCKGISYCDYCAYPWEYQYYTKGNYVEHLSKCFVDKSWLVLLPVPMSMAIHDSNSYIDVINSDGKTTTRYNRIPTDPPIAVSHTSNTSYSMSKHQENSYYATVTTRAVETDTSSASITNTAPVVDFSLNRAILEYRSDTKIAQDKAHKLFQWYSPTSTHFIFNGDPFNKNQNGSIIDILVIGETTSLTNSYK